MTDTLDKLLHLISPAQAAQGFTEVFVKSLAILLLAFIVQVIAKAAISNVFKLADWISNKEQLQLIDRYNISGKLARIAGVVVMLSLFKLLIHKDSQAFDSLQDFFHLYAIYVVVSLIFTGLNVVSDIYQQMPIAKDVPIKGIVQVIKLLVIMLSLILIISALVNQSPVYLLSSLGALTALIILVFRDTILGFVAGLQIIANRLIAVGDWIEMPAYGADGDVLEIGLTTVKIRNFDKTITSLPTSALMTSSFKNWRGMKQTNARRIKRAILIDQTSIKPARALSKTTLAKFGDAANQLSSKETNLGLYRNWLIGYLQSHEGINKELTLLVRQLAPSAHGLPLEIYCFANDIIWANYENLQSELIEAMLIKLDDFELQVFQGLAAGELLKG